MAAGPFTPRLCASINVHFSILFSLPAKSFLYLSTPAVAPHTHTHTHTISAFARPHRSRADYMYAGRQITLFMLRLWNKRKESPVP